MIVFSYLSVLFHVILGLVLLEVAEGVTVEEVTAKTEASFIISPNLRVMQQEAAKEGDKEHSLEVKYEAVVALLQKQSTTQPGTPIIA
jgi:acyl CoA:acetate/3-ketoacid CoA transferase